MSQPNENNTMRNSYAYTLSRAKSSMESLTVYNILLSPNILQSLIRHQLEWMLDSYPLTEAVEMRVRAPTESQIDGKIDVFPLFSWSGLHIRYWFKFWYKLL